MQMHINLWLKSLPHANAIFDRIAGALIEVDDGSIGRAHLEVHFWATHVSQALFRRVHKSRRNALALEFRQDRELMHPPAYSIKSRQDCACQSPFEDTNEKQLMLYRELPPNDIDRPVPRRIV